MRSKCEDAETLTKIAFAAKRHWGYPEQWIEAWREILTIEPEFVATHETYGAMVDGRLIGFYALSPKGERLDLVHLWVLPVAMGSGVGRSLFLHAVERARVLGVREVEIESDPNAAGFYQRVGARRIGSVVRLVGNEPRELPLFIHDTRP